MQYSITEEQLSRLAELNLEWPDEVEEQEKLVAQIRTQVLVPVEKMRQAFQESYVKTQDELQKELWRLSQDPRHGKI